MSSGAASLARPIGRWTRVGLGIGALSLCLFFVARRIPGAVEIVYSRGAYPWIATGLARASAWLPFSVGEIALVALPLLLGHGLVSGWRAGR